MKLLLALILLMTMSCVSCGKKDDDGDKAQTIHDPVSPPTVDQPPISPDPGPDPAPEPTPVPPDPEPLPVPVPPEVDLSKSFKVNVKFFGSAATDARKAKYKLAMDLVKKGVGMPAFKAKILGFDGPCTVNKFFDTTESNARIYQHILEGNETLQPEKDNELDVEVEFYYAATTTIGYTYGTSKRIWVNTKYFDKYTPPYVADNLMHEWLHKLGYKHSQAYTSCRPSSVPYAIGYILEALVK